MKFYIYLDKKNLWRWRLKARNGRTVAESGQGYKRKASCFNGIFIVKSDGSWADIVEIEE